LRHFLGELAGKGLDFGNGNNGEGLELFGAIGFCKNLAALVYFMLG